MWSISQVSSESTDTHAVDPLGQVLEQNSVTLGLEATVQHDVGPRRRASI